MVSCSVREEHTMVSEGKNEGVKAPAGIPGAWHLNVCSDSYHQSGTVFALP